MKTHRHKGKTILSLDFSRCSYAEAWALLKAFEAWIPGQEKRSVNLLLQLSQFWYDPVFIMRCRVLAERHESAFRKCAMLNASPFALWLVRNTLEIGFVSRPSGKKMANLDFDSLKKAKAWLAAP